jgi:hypothetical protein
MITAFDCRHFAKILARVKLSNRDNTITMILKDLRLSQKDITNKVARISFRKDQLSLIVGIHEAPPSLSGERLSA